VTEIMDFTPEERDIQFRINDDVFQAMPDMPALDAMKFASEGERFQEADVEERLEILRDMFRLILKPDSAERFIERLQSREQPIGAETMFKIIPWLMEQYGLRPTDQPDDSSGGSGDPASGTSSTGSAPALALASPASR
jgi:hypothetical protein